MKEISGSTGFFWQIFKGSHFWLLKMKVQAMTKVSLDEGKTRLKFLERKVQLLEGF